MSRERRALTDQLRQLEGSPPPERTPPDTQTPEVPIDRAPSDAHDDSNKSSQSSPTAENFSQNSSVLTNLDSSLSAGSRQHETIQLAASLSTITSVSTAIPQNIQKKPTMAETIKNQKNQKNQNVQNKKKNPNTLENPKKRKYNLLLEFLDPAEIQQEEQWQLITDSNLDYCEAEDLPVPESFPDPTDKELALHIVHFDMKLPYIEPNQRESFIRQQLNRFQSSEPSLKKTVAFLNSLPAGPNSLKRKMVSKGVKLPNANQERIIKRTAAQHLQAIRTEYAPLYDEVQNVCANPPHHLPLEHRAYLVKNFIRACDLAIEAVAWIFIGNATLVFNRAHFFHMLSPLAYNKIAADNNMAFDKAVDADSLLATVNRILDHTEFISEDKKSSFTIENVPEEAPSRYLFGRLTYPDNMSNTRYVFTDSFLNPADKIIRWEVLDECPSPGYRTAEIQIDLGSGKVPSRKALQLTFRDSYKKKINDLDAYVGFIEPDFEEQLPEEAEDLKEKISRTKVAFALQSQYPDLVVQRVDISFEIIYCQQYCSYCRSTSHVISACDVVCCHICQAKSHHGRFCPNVCSCGSYPKHSIYSCRRYPQKRPMDNDTSSRLSKKSTSDKQNEVDAEGFTMTTRKNSQSKATNPIGSTSSISPPSRGDQNPYDVLGDQDPESDKLDSDTEDSGIPRYAPPTPWPTLKKPAPVPPYAATVSRVNGPPSSPSKSPHKVSKNKKKIYTRTAPSAASPSKASGPQQPAANSSSTKSKDNFQSTQTTIPQTPATVIGNPSYPDRLVEKLESISSTALVATQVDTFVDPTEDNTTDTQCDLPPPPDPIRGTTRDQTQHLGDDMDVEDDEDDPEDLSYSPGASDKEGSSSSGDEEMGSSPEPGIAPTSLQSSPPTQQSYRNLRSSGAPIPLDVPYEEIEDVKVPPRGDDDTTRTTQDL